MDGFPNPTPSPVSMGSFISTILQVKAQLDFIDQFLTLYVPEYVHLKNYAIETQQNGTGSVVPPPMFPTTTQAPLYERMPSTSTCPAPTESTVLENKRLTANCVKSDDRRTSILEKAKTRRKQTLVKNPAAPDLLKRRGRKRKCPILNPVATTNAVPVPSTINHNAPQNAYGSEGVIKIYIPPPSHTTVSSKSDQPCGTEKSGSNVKQQVMTSLDVLAAVSYVLTQKEKGNVRVVQEVPNNSLVQVNGCRSEVLGSECVPSSSSPFTYQEGLNSSFTQSSGQENSNKNFAGNEDEVLLNGQAIPQKTMLVNQNHHQYQTVGSEFLVNLTGSPPSTVTSDMAENGNQEDYNMIVGRSPEHELIV